MLPLRRGPRARAPFCAPCRPGTTGDRRRPPGGRRGWSACHTDRSDAPIRRRPGPPAPAPRRYSHPPPAPSALGAPGIEAEAGPRVPAPGAPLRDRRQPPPQTASAKPAGQRHNQEQPQRHRDGPLRLRDHLPSRVAEPRATRQPHPADAPSAHTHHHDADEEDAEASTGDSGSQRGSAQDGASGVAEAALKEPEELAPATQSTGRGAPKLRPEAVPREAATVHKCDHKAVLSSGCRSEALIRAALGEAHRWGS